MLGRSASVVVWVVTLGGLACVNGPQKLSAQVTHPSNQQLVNKWIGDAIVRRAGTNIYIDPDQVTDSGEVMIPRFCGTLRASIWIGDTEGPVTVHSEPECWLVKWSSRPNDAHTIVLSFDQRPELMDELKPVHPQGDASVMLHAYQATTTGEKLRYEPQPHKNTVGYWTIAADRVAWRFRANKPGKYNVAVLQGCGAGQGGSRGELALLHNELSVAKLEFTVQETGHFQDFVWNQTGSIMIGEPGDYSLVIKPLEIKKAAMMDVRSVHLVLKPSK